MRRLAILLVVLPAWSGCGLGPGEEREGDGAELRITRDFGHQRLASETVEPVREGQTVLRLLQSKRKVATRYGGGFVQSIDGLAGRGQGGRRAWVYFVNGIEADDGAADRELFPGDVVTWDYRSWQGAMRVPAIVGAFPEPFQDGVEGKRLPVRVECEDDAGSACREVMASLTGAGAVVTSSPLGSGGGADVLRVVVATFPVARRGRAAQALERGPTESGVFARFADGGRALDLLDDEGRPVRRAPAGTGLVAATSDADQGVIWLVTGVDSEGVDRAAAALDERTLRDAFAVAVTPGGVEPLPLAPEDAAS